MDDNTGGDGIFIRTSEVLRGQNLSQSGPLAKRNYPKLFPPTLLYFLIIK